MLEEDQLLEIENDNGVKSMFETTSNLQMFWIQVKTEYPEIATKALKSLLPFPTPYLCEAGFSTMTASIPTFTLQPLPQPHLNSCGSLTWHADVLSCVLTGLFMVCCSSLKYRIMRVGNLSVFCIVPFPAFGIILGTLRQFHRALLHRWINVCHSDFVHAVSST